MEKDPQQQPVPTSQIAQDFLDQTETTHQDVRKKVMQANIKYKAYYDKKANASQLKEADNVHVLHRKAVHQGSKVLFTEFWWLGPYIFEKVLPNNNHLVHKIGTNKTQVRHRKRMRQFTPHQSPANIRLTPPEYKPDPDVSLKDDDLYARAWEYDYEQPIFDAENNNVTPPNSQQFPVQSDGKNYAMYQIRIRAWNLMLRQARNNQTVVRPTPSVPTTTYVTNRNLIATTITDSIS